MFNLPAGRPALMGILNVTPDSFSDGGVHFDTENAIKAGARMVAEGADIIDVGGESTRPGAAPISLAEEIGRVAPVVQALVEQGVAVSIDTRKPTVAAAALALGAQVVNDVSGLRDPAMIEVCQGHDCTLCVMHMLGTPETMQQEPHYTNVVAEVKSFLLQQAAVAEQHGFEPERIWIDPGIGFGKTVQHNLRLLNAIGELVSTRYPVLLGVSRKSFLGTVAAVSGEFLGVRDRLEGTLAAQSAAQLLGVRVIRAHDVLASRRAINVLAAIACA
jgi:dihydropteroate synthase